MQAESINNAKILLIEDEEDILELVHYNLVKQGYSVTGVNSGEAGLQSVRTDFPDLIILDLMLPGIDGLEVCRRLKADTHTRSIPIIIISARGEEADIVKGLGIGADDYVSKPFSPRILLARVEAVLRRKNKATINDQALLTIYKLSIDPRRFSVQLNGRDISLTFTEFRILHFLARHPGWVFTRYQIVDAVKGEDYVVTDRAVDVQIVGLRKKLGEYDKYIETVRGVGYRFRDE